MGAGRRLCIEILMRDWQCLSKQIFDNTRARHASCWAALLLSDSDCLIPGNRQGAFSLHSGRLPMKKACSNSRLNDTGQQ